MSAGLTILHKSQMFVTVEHQIVCCPSIPSWPFNRL